MTGRPSAELADRLALAIVEHGPSSGSRLAVVVAAQKAAVLSELRTNPMFESLGSGRGSRWRIAGNRMQPLWEPLGTEPGGGSVLGDGGDVANRLAALERRVAELEAHAGKATPAA